jgi:hypothetical protein
MTATAKRLVRKQQSATFGFWPNYRQYPGSAEHHWEWCPTMRQPG